MDSPRNLRYFYILGALVVFFILYYLCGIGGQQSEYFQTGGATGDNKKQGLGALTSTGALGPVDTAGSGAATGSYAEGSRPDAYKPGELSGVAVDPLTGIYSSEAERTTRNPYAMFATGPEERQIDPSLGGFGPEGTNPDAPATPRENYQRLARGKGPRYRYGFDDLDITNQEALPGVQRVCQKWGITPDRITDAALEGISYEGRDANGVKIESRPDYGVDRPSDKSLPPDGAGDCKRIVTVPQKVSCEVDGDCNIVFGNGENKCLNGKCRCAAGSGKFCHLKSDYYKRLSEMTPAQIIKFKKHGKLDKMTIRDYLKWLSLFKYDIENLPRQHLRNFQRYLKGLPVFNIPLSDPTEEFFADQGARRDRVCLDIPNSEIDSPLNYKIRSTLNNDGMINVLEQTERPLNWSKYYNHPSLAKDRLERTETSTIKDWFLNNINWLFYDIDRNAAYKDPQKNRFMNIIDQTNTERIRSGSVRPGFSAQRLATQTSGLVPTQEGVIAPESNMSNYASAYDPMPVDLRTGLSADAGGFTPVERA